MVYCGRKRWTTWAELDGHGRRYPFATHDAHPAAQIESDITSYDMGKVCTFDLVAVLCTHRGLH